MCFTDRVPRSKKVEPVYQSVRAVNNIGESVIHFETRNDSIREILLERLLLPVERE